MCGTTTPRRFYRASPRKAPDVLQRFRLSVRLYRQGTRGLRIKSGHWPLLAERVPNTSEFNVVTLWVFFHAPRCTLGKNENTRMLALYAAFLIK